jgi:hypothetical protein
VAAAVKLAPVKKPVLPEQADRDTRGQFTHKDIRGQFGFAKTYRKALSRQPQVTGLLNGLAIGGQGHNHPAAQIPQGQGKAPHNITQATGLGQGCGLGSCYQDAKRFFVHQSLLSSSTVLIIRETTLFQFGLNLAYVSMPEPVKCGDFAVPEKIRHFIILLWSRFTIYMLLLYSLDFLINREL